jgi:uncharacterized tellurite resistance protein B-like protein
MYRDYLHTPDQALVHLAFHCCLKDGELGGSEMDFLSSTFVAKGINKELDLKQEVQHYLSYTKNISDETAFLKFILDFIQPKYKLALFAFCAEIIHRDNNVAIPEEVLLHKIASLLYIKDSDNLAIQNLIAELNQVEKKNAF